MTSFTSGAGLTPGEHVTENLFKYYHKITTWRNVLNEFYCISVPAIGGCALLGYYV
jgi:hypothetical protein